MTNLELKNKIQEIANQEENTIERHVALEALESDDIKAFFLDLLTDGCPTGMIPSLNSYEDTHAFFDTHYRQIELLRSHFEDHMGGRILIIVDLKKSLAWFGFEQVALQMAQELGLEI